MNFCRSCGAAIPPGQPLCSMCYGDPYYGQDGYYLDWLRHMYEEAAREEEIKRLEYFELVESEEDLEEE